MLIFLRSSQLKQTQSRLSEQQAAVAEKDRKIITLNGRYMAIAASIQLLVLILPHRRLRLSKIDDEISGLSQNDEVA